MSYLWEKDIPYSLLALLVLAVFYEIYFTKQLAQRRRGIQTRQIGRRKEYSYSRDAHECGYSHCAGCAVDFDCG